MVADQHRSRLLHAGWAPVARPGGLSADRLIEGLWDDTPPLDAPKALQVLVTRLRKRLEQSGIRIVLEPAGYRLDMDTAQIDAVQFRRLCAEEWIIASTDLIARRRHLE